MSASRLLLAILALPLCLPAARAQEDYAALLEEAVATVDWDFSDSWSYTEASYEDGETWIGRFDPRVEEDHGWTLVSVDGKTPTDRQRREYLHNKDEHSSDADDEDNRVTAIVDEDTLELIEETDEHWVLSFVPAEDEQALLDSVDARVRIVKNGRYIESVRIDNFQDIEPGFGTKLTEFKMRFSFGPAVENGPIVPKSIEVRVKGRALLFFGFDDTDIVRYTDFEYAGG